MEKNKEIINFVENNPEMRKVQNKEQEEIIYTTGYEVYYSNYSR